MADLVVKRGEKSPLLGDYMEGGVSSEYLI
jgi:hypothetical protein